MVKRDEARAKLQTMLSTDAPEAELEQTLLATSGLPGPRANLEQAWAFADCFEAEGVPDRYWAMLNRWMAISADEAGGNHPRVYLPFCALQAMGASYAGASPQRSQQIVDTLWMMACDGRWRIREGVAQALQRIAEHDWIALVGILAERLPVTSRWEQRAILAALAHPPILKQPPRARYALEVTDNILREISELDPGARRTEPYRVLRQALEYAPSVFVAALPEGGFAFLRTWALSTNDEVRRVVRANLGKARLAKAFPSQTQQIHSLLADESPRDR